MNLPFLPQELLNALSNLNYNYLTEIRIRRGQPVIIEYRGEYKYINSLGITENKTGAIYAADIDKILQAATNNCIYNYSEQIKCGFITVGQGIRIGLAGEYVTQNGEVQTIKNVTSLNIRISHNVIGCSSFLMKNLFLSGLHSTMIYSKPGLGKTTLLRDLAISLSSKFKNNVLVLDERGEISALDGNGLGYDLGDRVDILRFHNKKATIASAIRAMKPQLIITDELYGEDDYSAIKYVVDCGITVIASSHICDRNILQKFPFEYYVEIKKIAAEPIIYDKNFNSICSSNSDNGNR